MEPLNHLIDRFCAQQQVTRDELMWWALVVGLAVATVQLVTMLLTRWGDRNPTSKALIFSVIVHLSTAVGVVVIYPPRAMNSKNPNKNDVSTEELELQELEVVGDVETPAEQEGNTPVWQKLPTPKPIEMARINRPTPTFDPMDAPERQELPPIPVPQSQAQVNPLLTPEATSEQPELQMAEVTQPMIDKRPVLPLDYQQKGPENKEETQPAEQEPQRFAKSLLANRGVLDHPLDEPTRKGSVEQITPDFDPSRQLALLNEPTVSPEGILSGPEETEVLQPRIGPELSALPDKDPGISNPEVANLNSGQTQGSPFSRLRKPGAGTTAENEYNPFEPPRSIGPKLTELDKVLASRDPNITELPPLLSPSPQIVRIPVDTPIPQVETGVPEIYQLRDIEIRRQIAIQRGGTEQSEKAVELALAWLARNQEPAGNWDADKHGSGKVGVDEQGIDRKYAGKEADTGVTALAVLAFLGAGHTNQKGEYQEVVDRALRWMVSEQRADGYLGGESTHYAMMYCHGMATYALAEAYGMSKSKQDNAWMRGPLELAVDYILDMQHPEDGGWRYVKGQMGDVSLFGWQMMALKSAELNGIQIPVANRAGMATFLKNHSLGQKNGLAAYRLGERATAPMTAEALFCKQMMGIKRDDPACKEAVAFLMQNIPRRSQLNLYYWYYGTLAMFQYGGDDWTRWNFQVRETLINEQIQDGPQAGSWEPRDVWGQYGGRIYSTALSALSLEVYYRFLPLYNAQPTQ